MKLPRELGPIHFVGIGGIGMSGIAEVLLNLGYTVQGSDAAENANVKRLARRARRSSIGHGAENLGDAAVVVVSTAIKRDNPELVAAREKRLPVVRRAEMLAELMRLKQCVAVAGTHGKTTTTSLVATLLDAGGPRSDRHQWRHHQRLRHQRAARRRRLDGGRGRRERRHLPQACRPTSPSSPTSIPSISITFTPSTRSRTPSAHFVENLPFYGFAVMCLDHPTVQELVGKIEDRRVITYGENPQADVRLLDVDLEGGVSRFNVLLRDRKTLASRPISRTSCCRCPAITTR